MKKQYYLHRTVSLGRYMALVGTELMLVMVSFFTTHLGATQIPGSALEVAQIDDSVALGFGLAGTRNGTISEVDLTRGIVRRNLIAGKSPEHMIIEPDAGVIYVADSDVGQVLELDLTDQDVRRSFDIGGEIHGLGLSDDRTRLFVAGREENKLAAIDLDSGLITTVALSPEPYHLTTIPGTGWFFVSSRAEPLVWIVEDINLSVAGEFPVNGEGHQIVATQ